MSELIGQRHRYLSSLGAISGKRDGWPSADALIASVRTVLQILDFASLADQL